MNMIQKERKVMGWAKLLPIILGFFIMGFVDVVGIAANYIKCDFLLSDTLANLIPMMVFLWFAVCSLPTGVMMGKIGKRNTVFGAMGITVFAMSLPLLHYSFFCLLVAFALLGIGNTMLQVALNPMVAQVITHEKVASILTLGQFVKAVSSFLGPIIAVTALSYWGDWKLIFVFYAVVTLVAVVWLWLSVKPENKDAVQFVTLSSVLILFSDRKIVWLFVGILSVTSIDVGLNACIPKLLMEQAGLPLNQAGLGTSLYFIARTMGTLIGTFVLYHLTSGRFLRISLWVALIGFILLLWMHNVWLLCILIAIVGIACSNVFSILLSCALCGRPHQINEISGLMIMGISGGALIMPVMGIFSDCFGQVVGLFPLLCCLLYLLWLSMRIKE